MKKRNNSKNSEKRNPPKENGKASLFKEKSQSPTPEQIQRRAHEIFLARGGSPGQELDDWLQAERELKVGLSEPLEDVLRETDKQLPR